MALSPLTKKKNCFWPIKNQKPEHELVGSGFEKRRKIPVWEVLLCMHWAQSFSFPEVRIHRQCVQERKCTWNFPRSIRTTTRLVNYQAIARADGVKVDDHAIVDSEMSHERQQKQYENRSCEAQKTYPSRHPSLSASIPSSSSSSSSSASCAACPMP